MTFIECVPYTIMALTGLGAILQFVAIANYKSELSWLESLRTKILASLQSPDSNPLNAETILAEESVPHDSLVGTRTRELDKFSQYPGMVALHDLGAVAAEGDAGRIKNSVPSVLIASLLVIGLFGTLLSLKDTLQDPALTKFVTKDGVASASDFQKSLGPVLKGFGEAFTASLYGVGGTIVLIFIRIFVRAYREKCYGGIELFVVECLLPYYIEPEKTQLQRASSTLTETTRRFSEVTGEMNNSSSLMKSAALDLKESTTGANKTFGHDGAVVFQLSKFIEKTETFNNAATDLAEIHARSTLALESLSVSNKAVIKSLSEGIEQQNTLQSENLTQVKEMAQKVVNDSNSIKGDFIAGVNSLQVAQAKVVEALGDSAESQIKEGNKLVEAVASSYGGSLNQLNVENKKLLEMLAEHNKQQLSENQNVLSSVTHNLEILSTKLEAIAMREDRVDLDSFKEFREYLGGVNSKLDEVLKANASAIDNSFKVHNKMDQKMVKSFEDFSTRVNTLSRVIDKIAEAGSPEHDNFMTRLLGKLVK